MEKIYVDQNQQQRKQKRNKKLNSLNISLGLSFAVAFIAIASILFVSLSGTSYAADDTETLPEKLTTLSPGEDDIVNTPGFTTSGASEVTLYRAEDAEHNTHYVYCLESAIGYLPGAEMNRSGVIDDYGFIYLTSKLDKITVPTTDFGGITERQATIIKYWIEQTAIWAYLGKTAPTDPTNHAAWTGGTYYTAAQAVKSLTTQAGTYVTTGNTTPYYEKYGVVEIINKALTYHTNGLDPLTLNINKASGGFSLVNGDKYLRSPKLTVSYSPGQDNISSVQDEYELSVVGAPEGSYVEGVNGQGKVVTLKDSDLKNLKLSEYKEFYVVVPKDKVTNTTKRFSVIAKGKFEVLTGFYYTGSLDGDDAQTITTLKKIVQDKDSQITLEVVYTPDVPNTSISVSQSIYLIGLIVLLSGLGILYVNVRKQQKQN